MAEERPIHAKSRVESGDRDRRMIVHAKSARMPFFAALGLFVLWIAALVVMAVVSGERPPESRRRPAPAPATAPAEPEPPHG